MVYSDRSVLYRHYGSLCASEMEQFFVYASRTKYLYATHDVRDVDWLPLEGGKANDKDESDSLQTCGMDPLSNAATRRSLMGKTVTVDCHAYKGL